MSKVMQIRYRAARSQVRAPLIWLRHRGLDSNDVFLASYARSGSTLLRFLLAESRTGVCCSFDDIQQVVPEIGIHLNATVLFPPGGRFIKTHEPYRLNYPRAIYVVRDVRDVLLSAFAREKAMNLLNIHNLDEYIEPFMQGRMVRYGPWHRHVEDWLGSATARDGNLLVLRYEDMRLDVAGSLSRALEFLNLQLDACAIQKICEHNSIENMRPREDAARRLPKTAGEEGRQVGKGAVQGWRQKLTAKQLKLIDQYAGPALARLGYPTGSSLDGGLENVSLPTGRLARAPKPNANPHAKRDSNISSWMRHHRRGMGGLVADYFSWYRY
jgi:hypothetical protein